MPNSEKNQGNEGMEAVFLRMFRKVRKTVAFIPRRYYNNDRIFSQPFRFGRTTGYGAVRSSAGRRCSGVFGAGVDFRGRTGLLWRRFCEGGISEQEKRFWLAADAGAGRCCGKHDRKEALQGKDRVTKDGCSTKNTDAQ